MSAEILDERLQIYCLRGLGVCAVQVALPGGTRLEVLGLVRGVALGLLGWR